jgi:probable F420-dependent oxidoreductase
MAKAAEEAGFWSMAISDHVVHPEKIESEYPYAPDGKPYWPSSNPWPDPFVTIAAMAAVTERLRFFTNVLILPARNPFLVAKQVSTAAVLSGNRVALGIGVGWMREEFELLEQEFTTRGKRTNEAIEILRLLWGGGMVEYHGAHYDFDRLEMAPAPSEPIPLYCGGLSKPALRRAARLCDGWINVVHTLDELKVYVSQLTELRCEYGRENEPFEIVGASGEVFDLDGYRRLGEVGVTSTMVIPWMLYEDVDATCVQGRCDAIRRFGDDVIAKIR